MRMCNVTVVGVHEIHAWLNAPQLTVFSVLLVAAPLPSSSLAYTHDDPPRSRSQQTACL